MSRRSHYLPAVALQLLGVTILVGQVVFWALTGHESPLFVGAAMSLIGLGAYQGLRITVRVSKESGDDWQRMGKDRDA